MLAPPNMTLGEAARKYIPASRFNEGTPLTDADYVRAAEVAIHQRDDGSSMALASEAIRLNPKSAAAYYVRGRARYGGLADGEKSSVDDLKRSIELGLGGPNTAIGKTCVSRWSEGHVLEELFLLCEIVAGWGLASLDSSGVEA